MIVKCTMVSRDAERRGWVRGQTCLLTIGKGAFMSWLVKSTGVGCVKTSWYYFPGFFVLENFTLWRFYVADASRFY